ncbi:Chemotaxis protein histidine kinase and related kinase [Hahella chejuensis KCTC 2396]|uniref:Chemotaxis protein CheA n=1 Tax=Hahella chejuensis (strain KCTC 2396) TaxID=349521 RepID=Q2SFJ9_HAHCH|nr:response regulator [Hahella chejuensis]ABC30575.1 Chemotaxis protein histidine kinase and related kinase [Hahella chejuensis KCTC 2396]
MQDRNEALKKRLLEAFRMEAGDRMRILADAFAMSADAFDAALVESVFREVHSLKGAARAVSLGAVEKLCQAWETLLADIKHSGAGVSETQLSVNRKCHGLLRQLMADAAAIPNDQLSDFCRRIERGEDLAGPEPTESLTQDSAPDDSEPSMPEEPKVSPPPVEASPAPPPVSAQPLQEEVAESNETAPSNETGRQTLPQRPPELAGLTGSSGMLRIKAEHLDELMYQVEDLQQAKLEATQACLMLKEAVAGFTEWRKHRHEITTAARQLRTHIEHESERQANRDLVSVSMEREQQTLIDFSAWASDFLGQWEYRLSQLAKISEKVARGVATVADGMHSQMQTVLLLPCSVLVEGLPAMVQDIAGSQGKKVRLRYSGETLQVDKRVLDELKSPLQHMLRNAVDHGVETPARRRELGKPECALIELDFMQENAGLFEVRIRDDGVGFDPAKLKAKAIAQKVLDEDKAAAMSDKDAAQLAFTSGVSTSSIITDLSGRGLGLAIVREKVERLGGRTLLETTPGGGSAITLQAPTSMATYRALLVRVEDQLMAIPAQSVERVLRLPQEEVKSVENRLSFTLHNEANPLWRLSDILGLGTSVSAPDKAACAQIAVMNVNGDRFGLMVDEVIGDHEVIIKPLGPQLLRVRNVLGATQMGDGRIVPILHPFDLYKSACNTDSAPLQVGDMEELRRRKRILIAEDSVTSRGLLKTILESAGYDAVTANDGVEAWEALKQGAFDLMVSDIEMPRLDGFGLTAKVRADRRFAELPVVLVTALQSPEDKERGMEAGANAYIVKSGFDQANLLEIIRQLL